MKNVGVPNLINYATHSAPRGDQIINNAMAVVLTQGSVMNQRYAMRYSIQS
jgi:hypothetical protein